MNVDGCTTAGRWTLERQEGTHDDRCVVLVLDHYTTVEKLSPVATGADVATSAAVGGLACMHAQNSTNGTTLQQI